MKQRVLSGIVIALLTITSVYCGGLYYYAMIAFIGIWGSYEFCKCKNRDFNIIEFISMIISIALIIFFYKKTLGILSSLMVVLLTIAVFDEKYSFVDACVCFLETTLLGFALYQMLYIQSLDKWLLGYIIVIAYLTDAFALFAGMKFGKHKLIERISPKKTIEGAIGGWLLGCIISLGYASYFKFFGLGALDIVICSVVLPVISQIGDLIFSLIKRYYGIKDFSKLIPGHGGILDRLDSLSFVLIIFEAISIFMRV